VVPKGARNGPHRAGELRDCCSQAFDHRLKLTVTKPRNLMKSVAFCSGPHRFWGGPRALGFEVRMGLVSGLLYDCSVSLLRRLSRRSEDFTDLVPRNTR
jgi:hypothetical protein